LVQGVPRDVVHFKPELQAYEVPPGTERRVEVEVRCKPTRPESGSIPIQVIARNAVNRRDWGQE
jgi:hypothetical protein